VSDTKQPQPGPNTVTYSEKGIVCPRCGARSDYVLAHIGGTYSYQPCGCYGGTVPK
jgi:hypothetical protein